MSQPLSRSPLLARSASVALNPPCLILRLCVCLCECLFLLFNIPLVFAAVLWFVLEHFKLTVATKGHNLRHTLTLESVSVCVRACPFWHRRLNQFCGSLLILYKVCHHVRWKSKNSGCFSFSHSDTHSLTDDYLVFWVFNRLNVLPYVWGAVWTTDFGTGKPLCFNILWNKWWIK